MKAKQSGGGSSAPAFVLKIIPRSPKHLPAEWLVQISAPSFEAAKIEYSARSGRPVTGIVYQWENTQTYFFPEHRRSRDELPE